MVKKIKLMKEDKLKKPSYLFEVSWEVCNKVGGIHTVISTKALGLSKEYADNHILIGPDVWRGSVTNPEFEEDKNVLKSWRIKAQQEGLRIKIGRWKVAGNPIVILVDFSALITEKDKVFKELWENYKLDSITGQWDYIEPTLFGYAAGKIIESVVRFEVGINKEVVAQFHEWMTGSGVLYLKKYMPRVACVFTTHATVLGRCIAGNNLPLYDNMESYNPDELARRFSVVSKHSLEKLSAENADCFTTVSDLTARECKYFLGKEVDLITPNGFENVFTPSEENFDNKRKDGRDKLRTVAEALLMDKVSDDALYVGIGGRYEFKNKGLDVFVDAMSYLNGDKKLTKEVIAFIMIPAGNKGPNKYLLKNMNEPNNMEDVHTSYLTHFLSDEVHDSIVNKLKNVGLNNSKGTKVKIVYVPSYLNGNDGIFNMTYYDLLIGLDISVFPSYYEPWGYTPLESLAFKVPTITTSLAGFGLWVRNNYKREHLGINVVDRNENNYKDVCLSISDSIARFSKFSPSKVADARKNAKEVCQIALWENLLIYYDKAYNIALSKVVDEMGDESAMVDEEVSFIDKRMSVNNPTWFTMMVNRVLPEKLKPLEIISKNLWWSWNDSAREIFRKIDVDLWRESGHNPILLLDCIDLNRYNELENDTEYLNMLNSVYAEFCDYMKGKENMSGKGVAYFCMEYGLHTSLKIYSGGLGVLAGDYLKEASDKSTKITAIGLLYRYGYFTQRLSANGEQEAHYESQDFMKLPTQPVLDESGQWLKIGLSFPGRNVYARVWKVAVGRIDLYLLDTDIEDNIQEDQSITYHLYGGDWENRLKQELVLGVGGIRLLKKLGIKASTYHCNEGHAAFLGMERLADYIKDYKLSYTQALEIVRASTLFTTHTPVPAGHDAFDEDLLRKYISPFAKRLAISWDQLLGLGRINMTDHNEKFSMSYLAAKISQEINGVSMKHCEVSRGIFAPLWPGYDSSELNITYVTNGVHYNTWAAPGWQEVHKSVFGKDFATHHYDKSCFEGIYNVEDSKIWSMRNMFRKRLIDNVKESLDSSETKFYFTPKQIVKIKENLRDDVLTIGFARRFATYKRANLLFQNMDRFYDIVNNSERPVQFIFAGKAHPADKAGQDLIKRIIEVSKDPKLLGKVIFVPNYDMDLAKKLVQGVDVWLNTPTRPLEASGTSGEKAAMNGVMHFSVLDGWWVEGYRKDAGWMLPLERTYENQEYQNEFDSECIYNIFEDNIIPAFYKRDNDLNYSEIWITYIKNTIANVASNFTSNRMLIDYENQYYNPMSSRYESLIKDNFAKAKEITLWKQKILSQWDKVEVNSVVFKTKGQDVLVLGEKYRRQVKLEIGNLDIDEVGVELIKAKKVNGKNEIVRKFDFLPVKKEETKATYEVEFVPDESGLFIFSVRVYPKNSILSSRFDFPLVKWI